MRPQDAVDDRAIVEGGTAPTSPLSRQQILQQTPLGLAQVAATHLCLPQEAVLNHISASMRILLSITSIEGVGMETKVVRLEDVSLTTRRPGGLRQENFVGNHERRLGRTVGISQFGVNHVELEPGAMSSLRHWHEGEDEFVYVLSGELTLIDENGEHVLAQGSIVGFSAGVPNAHHLKNNSRNRACFLAVGTRKRGKETIHYPDDPELGTGIVERDSNGERSG